MRYHPIFHVWRLHAGTDFRAYCGTPIMAAADGKVEWAKYVYGFGNQVMLYHGVVSGKVLYTSYNHLAQFAVSARTEGQARSGRRLRGNHGHVHRVPPSLRGVRQRPTVDPMTFVSQTGKPGLLPARSRALHW